MVIVDNTSLSEAVKDRIQETFPESAIQKVNHLSRETERADAFYSGLREKTYAEHRRRQELVTQKTRIVIGYERGADPRTPQTDAQVADCERKIAESYQRSKNFELEIQNRPPMFNVGKAIENLCALPIATKFVAERAAVQQSTDPFSAIKKVQDEIAGHENSIIAIKHALYPKHEVEARCHAEIDRRADKVKIDFTPQARPHQRTRDSAPGPGKTKLPMELLETGKLLIEKIDAAGLTFALHRNELKTLATDQLNELYRKNPLVIPADKRAERIAAINDEILKLSRIEEALIEVAEAQGRKVLRRPKAHPFAVLGIAIDTSPAPIEDLAPAEDLDFG